MIITGKKFASMCDVGTWEALATKADVDYCIDVAKNITLVLSTPPNASALMLQTLLRAQE